MTVEGAGKNQLLNISDFIARNFCPNQSYFENSRIVDLTFDVLVNGDSTRIHIVRVELEMEVEGKFVKYGEPNIKVLEQGQYPSLNEIESQRVVGYKSNGDKVILYDKENSPLKVQDGYHNGNLRSSFHNTIFRMFPFLNSNTLKS